MPLFLQTWAFPNNEQVSDYLQDLSSHQMRMTVAEIYLGWLT